MKDIVRTIDISSAEYPKKLAEIHDPPKKIYVRGALPSPDIPSVAIVGSRICSQYGRIAATQFGQELAQGGVQIISGLARGIDGLSQEAACMAGGKSFGILGCGVNVVYPAQNKKIYDLILDTGGGLISEVPPDSQPIGWQFAARNRIISALSDLILIIEAKEKSGTQITVSRAIEQGKDIYALPGRIFDVCSAGCNKLISQGAGIALSPEALLEVLGLSAASGGSIYEQLSLNLLEPLEEKVYKCLDFYPERLEVISNKSHIPAMELLNILFHLQMKGFAENPSQGFFNKTK